MTVSPNVRVYQEMQEILGLNYSPVSIAIRNLNIVNATFLGKLKR